MRNIC